MIFHDIEKRKPVADDYPILAVGVYRGDVVYADAGFKPGVLDDQATHWASLTAEMIAESEKE